MSSGRLAVVSLGLPVVCGLFAAAFHPAITNLVATWSSSEMYSYGFMVPGVSAALIWMRREVLRDIPMAPSLGWGSTLTTLGLLLLFVGRLSMVNVLEQFALILTIGGLTLLLLGDRLFRALAFPIGYLLAMVPFWDVFTVGLHPRFQDYSATMAVWTLRAFGIPVIRDGFFLELPNITLEVARECSGVNSLIALLCVGVPVTYLSVKSWWKRALILVAASIIALLSNGIRVATVSLFAYYGIRGANGDVHGPLSLLRTMFVSGVGFVVLFWLVSKLGDADSPLFAASPAPRTARGSWLRLNPTAVAVAVLILASAVAVGAWHRSAAIPLSADLASLPTTLGRWQAIQADATRSLTGLTALKFDETLARSYAAPDGALAHVFIGYYGQQTPDRELAGHLMRATLIGTAGPVYTNPIGNGVLVKDFLKSDRGSTSYITYWYLVERRILHLDYEAKLSTAWNLLTQRNSSGAVVVVEAPAQSDEPIERVRPRVREFIEAVLSVSRLGS